MSSAVLDASAVLALLLGEPGGEGVRPYLRDACLSAVNYSEVLARLAALCGSLEEAKRRVDRHDLPVVPFDADQAAVVASLLPTTRPLGLSLADRACLALGLSKRVVVVTADRAWRALDLDVRVECVR